MKRKDLIHAIEEIGCVLIRHGGRHRDELLENWKRVERREDLLTIKPLE